MSTQDTALDQLPKISAFVIKHVNWPAEVDPSAC